MILPKLWLLWTWAVWVAEWAAMVVPVCRACLHIGLTAVGAACAMCGGTKNPETRSAT